MIIKIDIRKLATALVLISVLAMINESLNEHGERIRALENRPWEESCQKES